MNTPAPAPRDLADEFAELMAAALERIEREKAQRKHSEERTA